MITDLLLHPYSKDPLLKRNLVKTVLWRAVGSVITIALVIWLAGSFKLALLVAAGEIFIKTLAFYFYENVWQKTRFGLLSKRDQTRLIRKENQPNLFLQKSKINRTDRELLNNSPSYTLWFTGLSGSGKSTLATETEAWLHQNNYRVYILDGDNTRLGINSDLSFSDEDRAENIRRVAEICKLFNEAGIIVIASFISPFNKDRLLARQIIGHDSFIEVFVDASLVTCQQRDPKGLYELAIQGKIKNFTGIDSPYEAPLSPDIHLKTDTMPVNGCIDAIKKHLRISKMASLRPNSIAS